MNYEKQHAKLLKLQAKADACTSRKEALKILKKSDKAIHKLSQNQCPPLLKSKQRKNLGSG